MSSNKLSINLLVVLVLISFSFQASAARSGTATFYTPPYVPSACHGFADDGTMIAAASEDIWDNGDACGRVYTVKCKGATNDGVPHPCKGGSARVTIVDKCPSPQCQGTIDLSQEAFATIANPDAGKILITLL